MNVKCMLMNFECLETESSCLLLTYSLTINEKNKWMMIPIFIVEMNKNEKIEGDAIELFWKIKIFLQIFNKFWIFENLNFFKFEKFFEL